MSGTCSTRCCRKPTRRLTRSAPSSRISGTSRKCRAHLISNRKGHPMGRLENKIALVTGGGSGIGRGCAIALAVEGARIIVGDVDVKGAAETCDAIIANGGEARPRLLDVSSETYWRSFAEFVEHEFGALHILVNNAGICISRPLLEMSFEAWRRQMGINLDGVFLGTKAMLPLMVKSGGGSVINISSVAG